MVVKAGAYIVTIDRKTTVTVYRLEDGEITFLIIVYQAVHGNTFLCFTDLPVSSSLII